MVEFKEATLGAPPNGAHECAPGTVATPDFTPDSGGNVTGPWRGALGLARAIGNREPLSLQVRNPCIHGPLEHPGAVSPLGHIPQQRLGPPPPVLIGACRR